MLSFFEKKNNNYVVKNALIFDIDGTLIRTSKESGTVDEAPLPQVADAIRVMGDVNHDGVAEALRLTRHLWQ